MTDVAVADRGLQISESAARRIAWLVGQEENQGLMLRVSVSGGGCSGFQYGFVLDDSRTADDRVFERNGAKILIDEASLDLLSGSEIDFVEDLSGSAFAIKNPQAKSTCGCGNSFSVG
ncbi:MAG: iron-sulfur cluster insertion protein ErpA [Rhodospirillaceae bacterium]|nr:iron-sulfur cluster insertion protein ErpA [Rhodospirillaceae bacterium]